MKEEKIFSPSEKFKSNAHINSMDQYRKMYEQSVENPEAFWNDKAERLHWFKTWDTVLEYDFVNADIIWYKNGKLNVHILLLYSQAIHKFTCRHIFTIEDIVLNLNLGIGITFITDQ